MSVRYVLQCDACGDRIYSVNETLQGLLQHSQALGWQTKLLSDQAVADARAKGLIQDYCVRCWRTHGPIAGGVPAP